jgi:hypothetical protein
MTRRYAGGPTLKTHPLKPGPWRESADGSAWVIVPDVHAIRKATTAAPEPHAAVAERDASGSRAA